MSGPAGCRGTTWSPAWTATRAETIAAGADIVWAFVAQMGWGRGGFYAYSFFDPRHLSDARGIVPRLQGRLEDLHPLRVARTTGHR